MRADLLIAGCFELSEVEQASPAQMAAHDRVVGTLALGKAGPIRHASLGASFLAARCEKSASGLIVNATTSSPKIARFVPSKGCDGSYTLLAGQLQDREELCLALGGDTGADDAALYAKAHARYGENCDRWINGDYAVVQWFPDDRRVRLARSATSTRPLHVWRHGSRIVVGSIPRVLFAAGLDPCLNENRLGDALLLNYRNGGASWFKGAGRVACGTSQSHDPSGARTHIFWAADKVPHVRFSNDDDYVGAVDEAFAKATDNAFAGIERPGIALSGGLDSQAVASYACTQRPDFGAIATFTAVPQPGWSAPPKPYSFGDESAHVRALAKMYPQLDPHFLSAQDRSFAADLDAMHVLGSWPMRNESNMHWIHGIYSAANNTNCDALVFGAAGNTGFSYDGATGYSTWLRTGQWGHLVRELKAAPDDRPLRRKAVSLSVMPLLPPKLRRTIAKMRGKYSDPMQSWCAINPEFARRSGALDRAISNGHDWDLHDGANARAWRASVLADTLSEGAEIDLALQLHHGVPSRDPTLYRPLLELCIGIPDDQYLRLGTDRWLARRLLKDRVPEIVRTERRFGRQSPDWAMRFTSDRNAIIDELSSMTSDPTISKAIDIERMLITMRSWSGEEDSAGVNKLAIHAGVGRAVSTGRFVRYVQKRNDQQ